MHVPSLVFDVGIEYYNIGFFSKNNFPNPKKPPANIEFRAVPFGSFESAGTRGLAKGNKKSKDRERSRFGFTGPLE